MPVFRFEKISPPEPATPPQPAPKPRGAIVQLIDRLVEARAKRTVGEEQAVVRGDPKSSE
jgi:hypothetical protein